MKKDTLIKDYLAQRKQELEEKEAKNQKKEKKSVKWTIATLVIVITAIGGILGADKLITNVHRNKFLAATDEAEMCGASSNILEESETYEIFEEKTLGNKNNNLINYGYYAFGDGHEVYIDPNSNNCVTSDNGNIKQITDHSVKYINIMKSMIYFRDDKDRKIYSCTLNGDTVNKIIDIKAGQFLVSGDEIYYINFDDGNKLYSYNMSSEKNEILTGDKVSSFAKLGDEFIYLDNGNDLKKCNRFGNITTIQPNVEKFYYNGKIVAQNNGNIITFTLDGKYPHKVISGNVELVGADKDNIYYARKTKLYKYNLLDTEKQITEGFDLYKGVFKSEGGYYISGSVKNTENNTYKDKIIIVSGE